MYHFTSSNNERKDDVLIWPELSQSWPTARTSDVKREEEKGKVAHWWLSHSNCHGLSRRALAGLAAPRGCTFESIGGRAHKEVTGERMHARARPAPIASKNIPQMVHPARGEEDRCTSGLHLYIYVYLTHVHINAYPSVLWTHVVLYTRCLESSTSRVT